MKGLRIFVVLFVVFIIEGCKTETHEQAEEGKFLVTSPIQMDTLFYKEYVSQVHSSNHIELRSQEKGYLKEIYVDEGQFVKKGELMFQIMPLVYQAESHKAAAEVNYTEIEYQNTKALADSNIVSSKELALAKAKLDKAKAELALAQVHLGFTEIRAPFDGIMGKFNVRLGSLIEEGELLTTLSDNEKMWVYFNVPEVEYLEYMKNKPRDKTPLRVNFQMANKELFPDHGIIETIAADFNNETGNIAFRATFPNPDQVLRHGETGNILMPVNLDKAILIPQKATFEILDKKYVFVVDKDNIVRTREIIIAEEIAHLYVIKSGIGTHERFLLEGLRKVKNNQEIIPELVSFNDVIGDLNKLHAE